MCNVNVYTAKYVTWLEFKQLNSFEQFILFKIQKAIDPSGNITYKYMVTNTYKEYTRKQNKIPER